MFFELSKLLWIVAMPLNALCLLALAGFVLLPFKIKLGKCLVIGSMATILFLGIIPVGPMMITWLERHYPPVKELPGRVDGIIVLGGMFESYLSQTHGHISVNDHTDRVICFAELAKQYPRAVKIFSGGSGDYLHPDTRESTDAKQFMALTGLNRGILYEERSRNTYENALYSKELAKPEAGENWIVITSGYHLPRTMGIFEQLDWPVIPYACDQKTDGTYSPFERMPNVTYNFMMLNIATRELLGSIMYRITGKSAFILPPRSLP
jgi:uncharacterized SAM-binding protein YcdF (DUF218 family)